MPEAVGPAAVPPPEGFVRVRMNVAYDGTPFHGFARNPDVVTVQSELENTLAQVLRHRSQSPVPDVPTRESTPAARSFRSTPMSLISSRVR